MTTEAPTATPTKVKEDAQTTERVFVPRADIYENGSSIHVVAEMPGVPESAVDITLDKNLLTVRGTPARQELPGANLEAAEYREGSYERSFTLSNVIDRDGIEATMRDGILRLKMPKAHEARARKIEVKGL